MSEVTLTLTCSSNEALLLLAFHDIISDTAPEDSIAAQEHVAWLIDEIGGRAARILESLEFEEKKVDWQLRELARMYAHLPRMGGS